MSASEAYLQLPVAGLKRGGGPPASLGAGDYGFHSDNGYMVMVVLKDKLDVSAVGMHMLLNFCMVLT